MKFFNVVHRKVHCRNPKLKSLHSPPLFHASSCSQSIYDLGGMDTSWNSSQWIAVSDSPSHDNGDSGQENSEDSVIPQYDGPADDKSGK